MTENSLIMAAVLAWLAGLAIPAGGVLVRITHIRRSWLRHELIHGMTGFGGGALIAAVALVLVPEGARNMTASGAVFWFVAGGALAMALDRWLASRQGERAQFLAMLLDFVPEAIALGASFASGSSAGVLLALLIALQNLPEGFNAFREMEPGPSGRHTLRLFFAVSLMGPISALAGGWLLSDMDTVLGAIMLAAGGGILYLVFEDIAPAVPLKRTWLPPLGAVLGFAVALAGHLMLVD
ncbi:MAG: divalent cation transporter [Alcanivoracaceae bacterium]|jgi:ZIP family zinc transporter|nr:divalent cation transporter [Alcanivoracaceae bacterium]